MAVSTNDIIGMAIALVVIGVTAAVGVLILSQIGSNSAIANDTDAQTTITNSKGGIVNLTTLLGVAGIVVVAGFIIYIIMRSFGNPGAGAKGMA